MKLRIKFTNTQKFTVQVEEPLFGNLKTEVLTYILANYDKNLDCIILSFNGKDPICSEDDATLESLGIVNGDLLTVIDVCNFPTVDTPKEKSYASSSADSYKGARDKSIKMEMANSRNETSTYVKISNLLEAIDGTPPDSVVRFFDQYSPVNDGEVMNLLIHINMIESGFSLGESPESSRSLPSCWRDMVSTIKYHHSGFPSFVCTIVIVTMGAIKQVLVSFSGQESEISVKLGTKEYIPSDISPDKLEKLSTMARIFRNKLLYPLQVAAHNILGLPAPWHLAGLPHELLIKIVSQLDLRSVLNLSVSCKRLSSSVQDNQVWYNIFKRDFSDQYHSSDTVSGADWKAKYKSAYDRKKEREKRGKPYSILEEPFPEHIVPPYNPNPRVPDPYNPFMPQPRAPDPYPHVPDNPQPNPYWDPDSPYFGGEIPPPGRPFPGQPNPFDPFGIRPRRPQNPLGPPFGPQQPGFPRMPPRGGPRFDFF